MLVKVEGRPDLMKDTVTGAVISVDSKKNDEYIRQKKLLNNNRKMQNDINELKEKLDEIDSLKNDMNEIKSLLNKLIDKGL